MLINLSKEYIAKIRTLIYLYFDALEYRISLELDNKTNRLLYNPKKLSYDDAVKILQLRDKLEILHVIEMELYQLLDSIHD